MTGAEISELMPPLLHLALLARENKCHPVETLAQSFFFEEENETADNFKFQDIASTPLLYQNYIETLSMIPITLNFSLMFIHIYK